MKKIVLGGLGALIAVILLAYGIFWLVLYFTMDTPKDNEVIERGLQK